MLSTPRNDLNASLKARGQPTFTRAFPGPAPRNGISLGQLFAARLVNLWSGIEGRVLGYVCAFISKPHRMARATQPRRARAYRPDPGMEFTFPISASPPSF